LASSNPRAIRKLLNCLDIEALDSDLFLGDPGDGSGRLFGGMVAAQSVIAAGRTVDPERPLHSLHAYFLRPGRHGVPIRFVVDRIRDGRSFTTRRVKAHQRGEAIFNLSASFAKPEEGIHHEDPMPDAPEPSDGLPEWESARAKALGNSNARRDDSAVEVRLCDPLETGEAGEARHRNWLRVAGTLPDDPLIHTAMLVYASDRTLLSTASRPHGLPWGKRMAASLDHAVWIHRPVKFDGWLLYASESPIARSARGLVFGAMYYEHGGRVATVAQEGLIRTLRSN